MSIDFILPDIGEGIVECELVEWLVKEGDMIVEDQPVADVMTDKALVQIPAMHSGKVEKLYYAKGDIAKVHQPLFAMSPDEQNDAVDNKTVAAKSDELKAIKPVAQSSIDVSNITEDFILPDIGEGIVECELVEWLVKEGDILVEDQPVADVMTDKALVQIPAMHAGKVVKLYYDKGEIAKVHAPLFAIERKAAEGEQTPSVPAAVTAPAKVAETKANLVTTTSTQSKPLNTKALASPAVRRIARELGVNIHQVAGSGKKGRVYKDDVVNFANSGSSNIVESSSTTSSLQVNQGVRKEAIKGIRAAMAKQMVNAVATIPHFTYCEEIDLTDLIALRASVKDLYAKQDIKITMMPFFMKAMSLALNEYPVVNSQVNDECTEITYFDDHNIGMAVDSKIGLLVPNIKQVQLKSIVELAKDISQMTNNARDGRVAASDLKGGTITISNIGAIGGTVATPIINKPEVAIVALGKVQQLPRFNDKGEVEARMIMQVSWSGDHRVIDGGTIARFCNLWKSYLEQPSTMLMNLA